MDGEDKMKNEPKFRGYSVEDKQWYYGCGWYTNDYMKRINRAMLLTDCNACVECDLASMGQSSGIVDVDEKEIYDGDICVTELYPTQPTDDYVLVVEYDKGRYWGVRRLKADNAVRGIAHGNADGLYEFEGEGLQVIGNVYEHGDMLADED